MRDLWRIIAGFSGAMAVTMGAIAAHAVADTHAADMIAKASLYQLIHSVLLLFILSETSKAAIIARLAFLTGIVFFSGGLYLQYAANLMFFKDFIPFGGICYIFGWLVLGLSGFKRTPVI